MRLLALSVRADWAFLFQNFFIPLIMRKLTILTLTILLSTLMAVGQTHSKQQLEDSIDKYVRLSHYYFRFDTSQTKWQVCIDKFMCFDKQLHAQQDSLYAIEQRKVLNKKYPEVGLK